eukprot:SAG31_NODE_278_length_18608_cov_10.304284_3_plen_157_part_00
MPQTSAQTPRGLGAPSTEEVQRMLDENKFLIDAVVSKQNEGKVFDILQVLMSVLIFQSCLSNMSELRSCRPETTSSVLVTQIEDCAQFLDKLHSNLMVLAALADAQQVNIMQREQLKSMKAQSIVAMQKQSSGGNPQQQSPGQQHPSPAVEGRPLT